MQISATRLCVILSSQFSNSAQLSALSGGGGGGRGGKGGKVRMGLSNPHRTIVAKCKTNNSNTVFPIT